MILLTRDLALARLEARDVFPNAVWLPGDEPPVGTQVTNEDGRDLGEVRGVCTEGDMRWWWFVAGRGGRIHYEWPPTLRPASPTRGA